LPPTQTTQYNRRLRKERRKSGRYTPGRTPGRTPGKGDNKENAEKLNHEIANHIANTIQLHTQNKINEKNAFSLPLGSMLRETQGQFERASVILEAGTKIYSKRVDSTLSSTFRVRENLFRNDGGKKKNKKKNDQEDEDDDASNETTKKSKRKVSGRLNETKTLETKMSNITIDSSKNRRAGTVFQKMRQFFGVNSGGSNASGMLLNKLGVQNGCFLSLGSFAGTTTTTATTIESPEKTMDDSEGNVCLDELSAVIRRIAPNIKTNLPEICPKLDMFYRTINNGGSSDVYSVKKNNIQEENDDDDDDDDDVNFETGDLDAFDEAEREEAALDFMLQHDDNDDDDNNNFIGNNNNTTTSTTITEIDHRVEQERHFDALEIAIRGATFTSTIEKTSSSSSSTSCNYDYFDRNWLRQQGSQWRRRRRMQWEKDQKNDNITSSSSSSAKTKGKRKRRAAFFFDFATKLTDEEIKSLEPTKAVSGKRAAHTWKEKSEEALGKLQQSLLLDDGELELEDGLTDVTTMGRLFLNPSIGLRDETTKKSSEEQKIDENDDDDDDDAAVPDYDGDDDDMFDDDDDDRVNFALDDKSAPLEFLDNFKASGLVQAEHKVERQEIHYETVAKRVDVGRLKKSIWTSIETKVESVEKTSEAIETKVKGKEEDEVEGNSSSCCFKKIMEKLSSTKEVPENVTVPFYFICTLHLANEHGLLLSHRDRLEEAAKQDGMTSGASLEPAALSDLNDFVIAAPEDSEWN